jgi:hypothetical protein
MSFIDNLAASPAGGIYGQPGQQNNQNDVLGIVNQLKDREMRDFQNKANFMSDLSVKQDRLKQLFSPETASGIPGSNAQTANGPVGGPSMQQGGMNVQMGKTEQDPNQLNAAQRAEMSMKQQGMGLEQQKIAQAGKMGEERLGIQKSQEQLNAKKEGDIHENAQAKLQAKIEESNGKLEQAQAALEAKTASGDAALKEHQALKDAMTERHKLELAQGQAKLDQKDAEFKVLQGQHDELIKQRGHTTETKKDAQGNAITTDTTRGSAANMVNMKGRDGKTYPVPADKAEEAKTHPFFQQADEREQQ